MTNKSQELNDIANTANGEVITGDVEYDGRVVLYIIKGKLSQLPSHLYISPLSTLLSRLTDRPASFNQPTKHPT